MTRTLILHAAWCLLVLLAALAAGQLAACLVFLFHDHPDPDDHEPVSQRELDDAVADLIAAARQDDGP